ncbi:unnamed protein product [Adineta steineri]|uniref:Uncharacterized protein n=1 Tax=Adineta steineri TaxID=433720 RepID=A0A819GJI8_9BILA|nr:unnamed protein product [Adineta steineri]CAF3884505.1 unnamed protein product [Adineta steineri]
MDKKQLANYPNDAVDTSRRSTNIQIRQNFILLWLDANINDDNSNNILTQLREIITTVYTFNDVNQIVDFATDIKDVQIFMIFSDEFAQTTIPIVHDIPQVSSIYISCKNKSEHEKWSKQWAKVKDIFTETSQICKILKQATQECDQNFISMSFIPTNDETLNKNLDELDQSFMYTQVLKEILLTIDFNQQHIKEFTNYYREKIVGDNAQPKNIDELEKEYDRHSPIWWYTSPFLYETLNRGLRTMDVDIIIKMGIFVRDIHQCIQQLHDEQYARSNQLRPLIVYRGQGLTQTDFDQMMKTKGGLISFNNFLSTSLDREVAFLFAESNQNNPDLIGVLFQITVNSSISSIPFADISGVSYYHGAEEEILFSMHSVFRIGDIKEINGNNRLWEVELILTSDNDPQLSALTEHIREETSPHQKGWHRLGQLLIKLGQINKAQNVYEVLLDQIHLMTWAEQSLTYHQLGSIKDDQAKYEEAIKLYEKSIEIRRKHCSSNDPDLITTYANIGAVYSKMGNYSKALLIHEKVLKVRQEARPYNNIDLSTSYINIGEVYEKLGKYPEALSFYEKNLDIRQKISSPNHPELANSYSWIGSIYEKNGEYSQALSYSEKSLEIRLKTLPSDHPDLAIAYNNIGFIYTRVEKYSEALSSYEKALEIYQKTLSTDHPNLAMTHLNIGFVHEKKNDLSKALSHYENACEDFRKTLPSNHPDLATSYSRIGGIYVKLNDYSKAFSFWKRSLEICIRSLGADHPNLAIMYENIALIYSKMGEHSKALAAYKMAFEIYQKSLPPDHPNLEALRIKIALIDRQLCKSKKLKVQKKTI